MHAVGAVVSSLCILQPSLRDAGEGTVGGTSLQDGRGEGFGGGSRHGHRPLGRSRQLPPPFRASPDDFPPAILWGSPYFSGRREERAHSLTFLNQCKHENLK